MAGLTRLKIEGFKSIRSAELELRPLNVLIGANGSGKSNLVSFFRLLRAMREGRLQLQVGTAGGPDTLLHYGSKVTSRIGCELDWTAGDGKVQVGYRMGLTQTDAGGLVFASEHMRVPDPDHEPCSGTWGPGHGESAFASVRGTGPAPAGGWDTKASLGHEPDQLVLRAFADAFAAGCFHFNDTTATSPMLRQVYIHDNVELHGDAGNLAAFLYMLRETQQAYYRRILDMIRLAAPFLDDFIIEPLELNPNNVMLNWRARSHDYFFGPHQLSDGTLRFIALATLLLQPEDRLPKLIVIDEPELGLHPFAISTLAGMLGAASQHVQVIVATQSAALVDEFEPEDILVAEHRDGESVFGPLNAEDLAGWLERYTLGELWEKNVLGGGPE
jgi:predicted ATPase